MFRVKYYCPVKDKELKFAIEAEDFCPMCNKEVDWSRYE